MTDGHTETWTARENGLPSDDREVMVRLFAGPVGNPSHPGYPGKPWDERSRRLLAKGCLLDFFAAEMWQTGVVTQWRELHPEEQVVVKQGDLLKDGAPMPLQDCQFSELQQLRELRDMLAKQADQLLTYEGRAKLAVALGLPEISQG